MPAPSGGTELLGPREILHLGASDVDELLDRLEAEVPVSDGVSQLPSTGVREAVVFGDTHGDWRSTEAVARQFLGRLDDSCLVGLGDYIDRPPDDCPHGSVANALYLLQLRAIYPDRVTLVKGNHEATRRIPVVPHDLPEEVDDLWGPEVERYSRILALIERGPWAALSSTGAYFAHAGFPSEVPKGDWKEDYRSPSEGLLFDTVWRDAEASAFHRGGSPPFGREALERFLDHIGGTVFLRGHDPDLTGRLLYGGRCLTLHTTRVYERYGGVVFARVPLDHRVKTGRNVALEHVATEGRSYEQD
ncbi:MAG TPA: metallophosphoesterase family protein [Thermoplasmata archaeon]|nr:metallophosphoesterase family protein [Thermoplasmata archaeon]